MKTARNILFSAALTTAVFAQDPSPSPSPSPSPEPLPSAALRVKLSDLAGALSNEGFKTRDRVWSGKIKASVTPRLAVNLFRGNQYWFCAAMDPEIESPRIMVFGPDGKAVEVTKYSEPGAAAAGVTAGSTGQYFVQIESTSGPASDFCFLYLFK